MANCSACGARIATGAEVTIAARSRKGTTLVLCGDCAARLDRALALESQGANLPLAIVLGIAAGAAAALAWYAVIAFTQFQVGAIVIGVGWLVGQAVVLGSGRKRGGALPWISVAIAACAVALGQTMITRHLYVQSLAGQGAAQVPLLPPLEPALRLSLESMRAEPLMLLFWGIAIWEAYIIPRGRRFRRTQASQQETER